MIKKVHIICHPNSGQGQGKSCLKKVIAYLDHYQIDYLVHRTNQADEAGLMAKRIVTRGSEPFDEHVLVIGGDGTLHDVVQSLFLIGLNLPILYIPAGTGNDFAKSWLKGQDYRAILDTLIFGYQVIDVPIFEFEDHNLDRKGIILNSMGFGMDGVTNFTTGQMMNQLNPMVAKIIHKLKLSYLIGLLLSLGKIPKFNIELIVDNEIHKLEQVSIANLVNNPLAGGGIQIDNLSKADRKELAAIIYHHIDAAAVRELFHKVLITKNQDQSKHINRYVGDLIRLKIDQPIQAQVDGEPFKYPTIDMTFKTSSYPFIMQA